MKRYFIVITLILGFYGVGLGQAISIKGSVIDKRSRLPVIGANIVLPDGTGISSGPDGEFNLKIFKLPIRLVISHIAYGKSEVYLNTDPKNIIIIELEESVSEIGEVQVTAKRLRILTEKDDFSLQDFACDKEHLWLLGYMKNQKTQGRLWLSNLYGDTIRSMPVHNPEQLYTDLLGNVHLVLRDSVYQLYKEGDSILVLYPCDQASFFQTMAPIKAAFAGKLVYQEFLPHKQGLYTYYYSPNSTAPFFLNVTRDSAEEIRQISEHIYGKGMYLLELAMSQSPGTRIQARRAIGQNKLTKHEVFNRKVQVPLFSLMDTLYLVNLYKDSLIVYNADGHCLHSVAIQYHRDSLLFDVHYRDLSYLVDNITQKLYLLQREIASWKLMEFNATTGTVGKQIKLPDFPGMIGIKVHGQAVYFLYSEKKYPNYVRLYRFQL